MEETKHPDSDVIDNWAHVKFEERLGLDSTQYTNATLPLSLFTHFLYYSPKKILQRISPSTELLKPRTSFVTFIKK